MGLDNYMMVFFHQNIDTAQPTSGFDVPPYHVESFQGFHVGGWHCVCNKQGINCLSFSDAPGSTFTSLEDAIAICEHWNTRANAKHQPGIVEYVGTDIMGMLDAEIKTPNVEVTGKPPRGAAGAR